MLRWFKFGSLFLLLIVVILYFSGEKVDFEDVSPVIEEVNIEISQLDTYISNFEADIIDLKPGNEAKIIWADTLTKQPTEYSIVYLHGFSASHEEGAPLHTEFANKFGANLLLTRLEDHGRLDSNSFINLTPANYLESAKKAISIGRILGEKVILMSCSTGSTLSAYLCAFNPWIHAQIMFSPNFDLYDPSTNLLTKRWGNTLARMSFGGSYNRIPYDDEAKKYWNWIYHINGILCVQYMIEEWMTEDTFLKIEQPTFMAAYYKNDDEQDKVISIERIRELTNVIATPDSKKKYLELSEAQSHVIASKIFSKEWKSLSDSVDHFATSVLGMEPVEKVILVPKL